jgi:hypothetical protein
MSQPNIARLLQDAFDKGGISLHEAGAIIPGYAPQSRRNLLYRVGLKPDDGKWKVKPEVAETLQPRNRPTLVMPREARPFTEYKPPALFLREPIRKDFCVITTGTSRPNYRDL